MSANTSPAISAAAYSCPRTTFRPPAADNGPGGESAEVVVSVFGVAWLVFVGLPFLFVLFYEVH
jgi:hypothetical protein